MGRTLTDEIYDRCREDIVTLLMKPGEKVSEAKLARRYHVSRAPIRHVLQRLQKDALVIVKPQTGTRIAPISLKTAREILEVRLQLECHAASVAADQVTGRDLAALRARFAELDARGLDPEEKAQRLFDVDSCLHQTIWRLCGNDEIIRILNGYRDVMERIRRATLTFGNRMVPSGREMHDIFAGLKARNPERTKLAMQRHITNISRAVAQLTVDEREHER
jgi:GntR family transcriptional regulator, rspAB operon transcriptional repressor